MAERVDQLSHYEADDAKTIIHGFYESIEVKKRNKYYYGVVMISMMAEKIPMMTEKQRNLFDKFLRRLNGGLDCIQRSFFSSDVASLAREVCAFK